MKTILTFLVSGLIATVCHAQTTIYMRLVDYNDVNIYDSKVAFTSDPKAKPTGRITHSDEVALATYADGDEQTLNIGSQSTGSGAGKVAFDSLAYSKTPDVQSPAFFEKMASGTPFKFIEFSFYKTLAASDVLTYKIRLSLVALKSIQRASAACSGNCPDLIENFTMEYGAKYITYYPQNPDGSYGTPVGGGWDRVKNISWAGVTALK